MPFLRKEILPRTALVIDDDPIYLYGVQKMIAQRHINARITSFTEAGPALDYIAELKSSGKPLPNVVLLDLNLPDMDGHEFLQELQQQGLDQLFAGTELFVVTSSINKEDEAQALANPLVSRYLQKPLTDQLLSQIFHLD